MKTTIAAVFVLWFMCNVGCERAPVDYSQHYKHGDDVFYKGTFVVKETVASIMRWNGVTGPDGTTRLYEVLGTDVLFRDEVVGSQLSHEKLLTLRRQGYRIIIK